MNTKGRITMDDVARDIDTWKGELKRALSRQGAIQLRLKASADRYEAQVKEYAHTLRVDAGSFAATVVPVPLPACGDLLDEYATEQRYISECKDNLRILRVPQAEIDAILQG
jgi:hypothetical protein